MLSVFTGDCFLGTKIDDKLAGTLALGKITVVTRWSIHLPLSIVLPVTIPHGDIVATTVTAAIGDSFLDV